MAIPEKKYTLVAAAEAEAVKIEGKYKRGMITNEERSEGVIKAWDECSKAVASELKKNFRKLEKSIWVEKRFFHLTHVH